MTVIVGLHDVVSGQTWLGADSQMTMGDGRFPGKIDKWVVHGRHAIATAGSILGLELIRSAVPDLLSGVGSAHEVGMRCRDLFRREDFDTEDMRGAGGPKSYRQTLIYATPEEVWDIDGTGCATKVEPGKLWARGSGMDYALGADHALRWTQSAAITPKQRIMVAIAAAIEHDTGCGGPIFVQQLGAPAA